MEARPWAGQPSESLDSSRPPRHPFFRDISHCPSCTCGSHTIPSQPPPSLRKGLKLGGSGPGFVGPEPLAVPKQGHGSYWGEPASLSALQKRGRCPNEACKGWPRPPAYGGRQSGQPSLPAVREWPPHLTVLSPPARRMFYTGRHHSTKAFPPTHKPCSP